MGYQETFEQWKRFATDSVNAAELLEIENDEQEKKERFSTAMSFGTAGLRAKLGVGTNRMNIYTVGMATQGLAEYVIAQGTQTQGMVIAYDTRNNSDVFAQTTAQIFAANGIKTYLFKACTSVPELSFAIRNLNAFGGVAITASHNPREYNGYKVYAPWGGQLLDDTSRQVIKHVESVGGMDAVKRVSLEEAKSTGMVTMLGADMDSKYYKQLLTLVNPELIEKYAKDIRFVYTPLYGTGMRTFEGVMQQLPYESAVVQSQTKPNGDFPGFDAPNPEDIVAMGDAIEMAKGIGADIAFGTDPDADRMGAAIPDENGEFVMLTGNQAACIIIDYLLQARKEEGTLTPTDFVIKSFVSTKMADDITAHYGVECVTVPTGFKYISDVIHNRFPDREFVFGFEESCGFLSGRFVADKDGVLAGLLLLEVLCDCKEKGETLFQRLNRLYDQYGWHKEKVVSVMLEGTDGMARVSRILEGLRANVPNELGGQRVVKYTDYQTGVVKDAEGEHMIDFPRSNALAFELEKGWLCIRPSGTEPKVKQYYGVFSETDEASVKLMEKLAVDAAALLEDKRHG